jgi:hypothetical protein
LNVPIENSRDFFGRTFTRSDFQLMRDITRGFQALSLTELANTVCELLDWRRANGKLKYIECRSMLEQLQVEGILSLPPVRKTAPSRPRQIEVHTESDVQSPLNGTAGEYLPLLLRRVDSVELSSLWNQFVDRYHYLKFRVPFGANLRYIVESQCHPGQYLACLLFSSPAWKMAPRDKWIGWSDPERKRNLQYIVCNSRFLILPWVAIRGLASKILSLAARQLPHDWQRQYGYRPLLLETLVDPARFKGTCYRAGNWIMLGPTQGRGRMDHAHQADGRAVKNIYVYPLCRDARRRLRQAAPPIPAVPDAED